MAPAHDDTQDPCNAPPSLRTPCLLPYPNLGNPQHRRNSHHTTQDGDIIRGFRTPPSVQVSLLISVRPPHICSYQASRLMGQSLLTIDLLTQSTSWVLFCLARAIKTHRNYAPAGFQRTSSFELRASVHLHAYRIPCSLSARQDSFPAC